MTQILRTTSNSKFGSMLSPPLLLRTTSVPLVNCNRASHAEPVAGNSNKARRRLKEMVKPHGDKSTCECICVFRGLDDGENTTAGAVGVMSAPPKGAIRMREKLSEYAADGAPWPLTGSVLDPVSTSISCARMIDRSRARMNNGVYPMIPICI